MQDLSTAQGPGQKRLGSTMARQESCPLQHWPYHVWLMASWGGRALREEQEGAVQGPQWSLGTLPTTEGWLHVSSTLTPFLMPHQLCLQECLVLEDPHGL